MVISRSERRSFRGSAHVRFGSRRWPGFLCEQTLAISVASKQTFLPRLLHAVALLRAGCLSRTQDKGPPRPEVCSWQREEETPSHVTELPEGRCSGWACLPGFRAIDSSKSSTLLPRPRHQRNPLPQEPSGQPVMGRRDGPSRGKCTGRGGSGEELQRTRPSTCACVSVRVTEPRFHRG